jgi:hypothetical protein
MGSVLSQKHHERSLFTGVCSISDENNARNTNLPTLINQISGAFQKQPYKPSWRTFIWLDNSLPDPICC